MSAGLLSRVVSRFRRSAPAHNTVVVHTVQIAFQLSPGTPSGDQRGVQNLDYEVRVGGALAQTGRTLSNGLVRVRMTGDEATLSLLYDGAPVASYRITRRADALEDVTTAAGQQRRLRILGYHLGDTGPDGNGVAGTDALRLDRATLEFQADSNLDFDGIIGSQTRGALTNQAGS